MSKSKGKNYQNINYIYVSVQVKNWHFTKYRWQSITKCINLSDFKGKFI